MIKRLLHRLDLWLALNTAQNATATCGDTGGEGSPYFENMQKAWDRYYELKEKG